MRTAYAVSAFVVSIVMQIPMVVYGQSLSLAKQKFDARDWSGAAASYEAVISSGGTEEKPEAAAFLIRSLATGGFHSQVEDKYQLALNAAEGTRFEAEVKLERAKSIQNNARDTTSATILYNDIIANYPSNVFAASGALYQQALIELAESPLNAKASFESVVASYSTSPFVDDAHVGRAKAGVRLRDLSLIDDARVALETMGATLAMRQKAQLERAEYMNRVKASRRDAIWEYRITINDYIEAGNTEARAIAQIRVADLVPGADFYGAIKLYQQVLDETPSLNKNLREWVHLHRGIYFFQVEDDSTARAIFESLLAGNPSEKIAAEATRYLTGLNKPDSTENITIHYDRAIRNHLVQSRFDQVFWDMQRIREKATKEPFQQYITNPALHKESRAQMMYRLAFANYHAGHPEEAFQLVGKILEEVQPEGVTRHQCLFLKAHLQGRASQWQEAIPVWQELIEENPKYELLTNGYLELSRALDLSGDTLGAVFQLDELIARFPYGFEAECAGKRREMILEFDNRLLAESNRNRDMLMAKWKNKASPLPMPLQELAKSPPDTLPTDQRSEIAKVGGGE